MVGFRRIPTVGLEISQKLGVFNGGENEIFWLHHETTEIPTWGRTDPSGPLYFQGNFYKAKTPRTPLFRANSAPALHEPRYEPRMTPPWLLAAACAEIKPKQRS